MKKFWIIAGCVIAVVVISSCSKARRSPGHSYMPDMVYSVAYETYAPTTRLDKSGAHYTAKPVEGTIARGDYFPYRLKNDTAGYRMSASMKSPLITEAINIKEAERLYLINCGICHGAKLDGNGPLYNGGNGPFSSAPKNFMADEMKAMAEGTMFHSVTYGKNMMGSYASQLNTMQRWMVIAYIKSKQAASKPAATAAADTAKKTAADTAKKM